jgi:hypothetical protein
MSKRLRGWALEKEMDTAAAPSSSSAGLIAESPLATKLLCLWAHGLLAAVVIQELAHLAILEGAQHPELAQLAKCGNFGETPGNVSKAVVTSFCKSVEIAGSMDIPVQCIDPKTSVQEEVKAAMFMPHMMFWTLATQYAAQFALLFCLKDLEKFWTAAEATGDDRLAGHPMTSKRDWRQKCIPLFLHGDGVEFQLRDSMLVWSWGCLLSLFSALDSHLLIALFPKSCTCLETWPPLMKWLVWSFKALLAGVHPTRDPDNKPFAKGSPYFPLQGQPLAPGGFRGVLWSIQGDHEFFSNVLKLPHWNNYMPCWECDCTQDKDSDGLPAPLQKVFRAIQPQFQQWVYVDTKEAAANPRSQHPIFSIPGVTSRIVRGDGLHIMFTKGIFAHLLGSVLHYMCWQDPPGSRQKVKPCKRLSIIFERVQSFYRDHQTPTRLTNLKISMFSVETKPWVAHPFLNSKAAESKHLAPAVLAVCKEILDSESPVDQHIVTALESMCMLVDLFDKASVVLSFVEHRTALCLAESFLDDYTWLHKWALEKERLHFHIVMKFHTFWHLVQNSKFLNPRFHWCFKSEEFVGRISRLANSVSMGVRSTKLSLKVSPKYRILMHLRFTRLGFGLFLFTTE